MTIWLKAYDPLPTKKTSCVQTGSCATAKNEKFTRRLNGQIASWSLFDLRGYRRKSLFLANVLPQGRCISRSVHARNTAQNLQPSWLGRRPCGLHPVAAWWCALEVLIVDDDRDSSEALAVLLAQAGVDVALADSARQAFGLFQERRFDVIVSDISMPGEDGLRLIQRIRSSEAREGRARLLAIALTTCDKASTIAAGFDEYLQKPLDLDALLSLLPSSRDLNKSLGAKYRRGRPVSGQRRVRPRDQRA